MKTKHFLNSLCIAVIITACNEPQIVDADCTTTIYLNTLHNVGGIHKFQREKYINFHGNQTEADWDGTEPLDYLLEDLDVYFGRDNETGHRDLQLIEEDPNKPGYPNIEQMKELGKKSRKWYHEQTQLHKYEKRNELIIATHVFPLFPSGKSNKAGWIPSNSEASGQFIGYHIKEYYGDKDGIHGEPVPKYFEIVNEPLWHLVTTSDISTPQGVFEHHNQMADAIRKIVPDILIGGYCAAFPDFEKDNFQRWHNRHKLFIDICGEKMDFLTFHTYDFPVFKGKQQYRSGSNLEATLDMLEQYSYMKTGKVIPWLVTEIGAQMHDLYKYEYQPYREWLFMKSANSQLMQYMEKPDRILKVMPFIVLSGYWAEEHQPYPWSLFKKDEEGKWSIYTDYIKYYQFWADVKGERAFTQSNNPDIQTQTYIDGKEVYAIFNNLTFEPKRVAINLKGMSGKDIKHLTIKHFHLVDSLPVLDTLVYKEIPDVIELEASSSMILNYELKKELNKKTSVEEYKYYAEEYLQEIEANETLSFHINKVEKNSNGIAVLRLGIGREHGKSLKPVLNINDQEVTVPENWRGDSQEQRDSFYGVLEVPVSYKLLQENNTISITFNDNTGYVSTVTLQTFNYAKEL